MWYGKVMNEERDPITEWEHAIERRIGGAAVVCMLIVVVGAMVAPLFGWAIKTQLYRYYALEDDCEQRVAKKNEIRMDWVMATRIHGMGVCDCVQRLRL